MPQPLIKRPEVLDGTTYRIKTHLSEHTMYVTINHLEVDGKNRPMEIFINSKCMENFTWIVALCRQTSAIFRREPCPVFVARDLQAIHDPKGGYMKPGGKWMPSLVAEIGHCLEGHMRKIRCWEEDKSAVTGRVVK